MFEITLVAIELTVWSTKCPRVAAPLTLGNWIHKREQCSGKMECGGRRGRNGIETIHTWRPNSETKRAVRGLQKSRCTGSSKINGAKFSDTCSVRANWLCMGWPFCLAEMRREFQTGGIFLHHAVVSVAEWIQFSIVQDSAKRRAPGCVISAGKARKQQHRQNSPNPGLAL